MPNHVHALLVTEHMQPLSRIVHSWKSYSANGVNKLLSRSGRLWRREYYDHFVRDVDEYVAVVDYIENNPVSAGLVQIASDWRWSSAWSGARS
jgi:putative DNA methylase